MSAVAWRSTDRLRFPGRRVPNPNFGRDHREGIEVCPVKPPDANRPKKSP